MLLVCLGLFCCMPSFISMCFMYNADHYPSSHPPPPIPDQTRLCKLWCAGFLTVWDYMHHRPAVCYHCLHLVIFISTHVFGLYVCLYMYVYKWCWQNVIYLYSCICMYIYMFIYFFFMIINKSRTSIWEINCYMTLTMDVIRPCSN